MIPLVISFRCGIVNLNTMKYEKGLNDTVGNFFAGER